MSDERHYLPSQQPGGDDYVPYASRENPGVAGGGESVAWESTGVGTVIEGATAPDQRAIADQIIEALKTIYDPEIPLNIYDLGLIYKIALSTANGVYVEMTLTAPGCPVAGSLVAEVERKIEALPDVPKVEVNLVWEPQWTRERLSDEAKLQLGLM